ncbi:hypothetical protein C8J35_10698 [Rhizobium sp. PP-F2F-G38]|nr:hypothetical protein C8J37_104157 [Rhizobium sp. PP-WC-1G-195]PYE96700.1 hypothetical protein C8J35_10698 [Rhizobium sp. PP-F2F-G38]TCP86112.1 hypothetical protein C8J31_10682 [Rhizobium sp. PP-CC-2G-626]TCQ05998.1 hypothetical protein C8J34_10681 [Rhizobium sp. PP-F2F-G36]TCQ23615.1 hypothetical protein C8J33_104195 [Rhizobium sp. PP-CC-3G-465]
MLSQAQDRSAERVVSLRSAPSMSDCAMDHVIADGRSNTLGS